MQRPTFLRLSSDSNLESGKLQENAPVFSPMTELAINFKENCNSYSSTPRRRLSLTEIGNTPTPVRVKSLSETESIESGIYDDFSSDVIDSPTLEDIRSRSRRSSVSSSSSLIRQATFRRYNSLQASIKCSEPLKFELNGAENPSSKEDAKEDDAIEKELDDVGLPDNLTLAEGNDSIMNRSQSAPPVLDSLEKYFTDIDGANNYNAEDDDGFDCVEDDRSIPDSYMPAGISKLFDAPILNVKQDTEKPKMVCSSESANDKENVCPLQEKGNVIHENKILEDHVFDSTFKRPSQLVRKIQKRSVSLSVKRTDSQMDFSPISSKRIRFRSQSLFGTDQQFKSPVLQPLNPSPLKLSRSLSTGNHPELHNDFLKGLANEESNLIGDRSKAYCLPTIEKGEHRDLNAITPKTLSDVLDGKYSDVIHEIIIVDCRYPYEYRGGHIKSAVNVYAKEDMVEEFLKKPRNKPNERLIIVFHCEFSSKRGPSLCRFLRNKDRDVHKNCYPKLYYPELYLLEGGYKAFFNQCKELCEPQEYLRMLDENHAQDLKHFTKRSKSWSEGSRLRTGLRY